MRSAYLLLALPLLATFVPAERHVPPAIPPTTRLSFTDASAALPGRELGRLVLLAAWSLRSNDPRFGGVSGLHVDKKQVTALTDTGNIVLFPVPARQGEAHALIVPLGGGPGPATRKRNRDTEALAISGNAAWISFERRNAVYRYERRNWRAIAGTRPLVLRHWPQNDGGEAMVRLNDGRFLLFAEEVDGRDGTSEVMLFPGDPSASKAGAASLRYRPPQGYKVTDAAMTSDGRILFLNRRFSLLSGLSAKITRAVLPPLKAGAVISGEEIATLDPAFAENFEGISVTQENGRDTIWVASDNNFGTLLQTLLLKFRIED